VETWIDGQLVGGLYCVALGRAVFGESMFALQTDASKIALSALVALCRAHQVPQIDCQQATAPVFHGRSRSHKSAVRPDRSSPGPAARYAVAIQPHILGTVAKPY
jgi:hypothetical protein